MYKAKIAIGVSGRVLFLEKFPDDEFHAGLNEMIQDAEDNIEFDEAPGVYIANCFVETYHASDISNDCAYLDIESVQPIDKQTPQPSNIISLNSVKALKEADQNLDQMLTTMQEMNKPDALQEQALKEAKEIAKNDPTITLGSAPDYIDSKDIYLRREIAGQLPISYEIVGLHAIGHVMYYPYTLTELDGTSKTVETNFMSLEVFGNEYDENHNMLGKGSFRLFTNDIEADAKEMEAAGWVRYEGPKRPVTISSQ